VCFCINTFVPAPPPPKKRLFKHGLWRMIAPFQALALRDYVENSGTAGIFRVKPVGPPLTDAERDAIVREAEVGQSTEHCRILNQFRTTFFTKLQFWWNVACVASNSHAMLLCMHRAHSSLLSHIVKLSRSFYYVSRLFITTSAQNLCHHYQPYDLFWRNCESAAFSLSPRTRRWVSPEVPNTWYML